MARFRSGEKRFWRWFRTLPILAIAVTLVVCVAFGAMPGGLGRDIVYPVHHLAAIQDSADRHGVDPYLVCAVIKCESGWDSAAQSDVGAQGLMQVMPSTAQDLADMGLVDGFAWDPNNLADPATNIEYGCAYLAFLKRNLSSTSEIVAAYNAGLGNVSDWLANGGDIADNIAYAETQIYLDRVTTAYEGYQTAYASGLVETS